MNEDSKDAFKKSPPDTGFPGKILASLGLTTY